VKAGGRGEKPQKVLVIDDAEDIHDLVEVRLRPEGVTVLHALDADAGMSVARATRPDLVLLDLDLAGRSGLDLCRSLLAEPRLASIPIIFLTGTVDVATKVMAFDAGAIDYVTKPFDGIELRARVRSALRTKRVFDLLETRAELDPVTGLYNRAHFDARLADDAVAARGGRGVALTLLEIDQLKTITETYGHPFADLVVRRVAEVVAEEAGARDVACRYAGESFGVISRDAGTAAARDVAERIVSRVAALELLHGRNPVAVTASAGYFGSDRVEDRASLAPEDLVAMADRGLYLARREGRNRARRGDDEAPALFDTAIGPGSAPPPAPESHAPGKVLGPYEVVAIIGSGGMGTVYRALDRRLYREVALKVLTATSLRDPDGWRRFGQEARALAALDHPSIVRVFDFGRTDDGEQHLALELLDGRTLRRRVDVGPMPEGEAVLLALELVRGLVVAHDKGIVHRDLKPENLFLTTTGALKILDFGMAKLTAPIFGRREPTATQAGMLLGTVGYLAPEQARGENVDGRADLFAVGAILYELVSGRRAFAKASAVETLHAVLVEDPPPLGSPRLDALIARCLAKKPEARVANARELEAALAELAGLPHSPTSSRLRPS
jgi:diguanylate cyclase (GGDEF)-like protein